MLVFEKSAEGRNSLLLPKAAAPSYTLQTKQREQVCHLPALAEIDVIRHYTNLTKKIHGVDNGFYPLGSCTMKYNPKLNEDTSSLKGFTNVHPLQPANSVQGSIAVMTLAEEYLCEITGMDAMTFQPAAGAQGELTGLLLIKAYHVARHDAARHICLVPDSAHGTNPASAVMAGFDVCSVPSKGGFVDLEALKTLVSHETAALMLTNPNTLGLFEKDILEITKIVHDAGGLVYYDGANLNAIMGMVRPGDMGFDVVHLNLHKTFSTPHGGGGPGSGPVGCKECLIPFLPSPRFIGQDITTVSASIGRMKQFHGNFLVVVRALTYIMSLGREGIKEASCNAVLNASYLLHGLKDRFDVAIDAPCMHEFVLSLEKHQSSYGVSAMDIAKSLIDYGIHPPTMYFPLIVKEALMFEPTETESKTTLDEVIAVLHQIDKDAQENSDKLHHAPATAPISRVDEVKAARQPKLTFHFE